MNIQELQDRAIHDSMVWFPDIHKRGYIATLVHFSLGIAGEVGEFVNMVKKFNRSDTSLIDRQAASHELADIAIYLLDICHTLDIDLEEAIEMKRKILIARWGDPDR